MNTQLKKRNLIQFYLIQSILRQNSLRQLRTKPTHHYNDKYRTRNTKEDKQQDDLFLYKSKGQHLLTNQRILDSIVRKSSINPTDTVLEIGPGTGNLTLKLLDVASKVVAVEIDKRMVEVLNKRVKEHGFEDKLSVSLVCMQVFDKIPERSCFVRTKVLCFWKWGYRFPLLLIYYAFTVRKI